MADCHRVPEEKRWIYLVRSLGFHPEPSSHDWHVQPSCQRTDPLPPERALSVQCRFAGVGTGFNPPGRAKARRLHRPKPACPRNLYKLRVLRANCQPVAITGFPPVFHNRGELQHQRVKDHPSKPLSFRAAHSRACATRGCRGTCFTCLRLIFRHATERIFLSASGTLHHAISAQAEAEDH